MDTLPKDKRSWNMSKIRSKNTAPEIKLRSLLHKAGYRFRIHVRNMPGCPDIVLPKYKTAVFVHGCFWHRHDSCKFAYNPKSRTEFWEKKFKNNVERDLRNCQELEAAGWRTIVVWECELEKDPQAVVSIFSKEVRKDSNGL